MGFTVLSCATHPTIETGLSCGRCGTPICGRCVVTTMVGTRCRACASPDTVSRRLPRMEGGTSLFGFPLPRLVWLLIAVSALLMAPAMVFWAWMEGDRERLVIRSVVYGGWVASLLVHELSHSIVAFFGGDREIRGRGYLTLNPFRYMDPVFSLAIPTFIVLMGGVPLIGGRTFVDHRALRGRGWEMAVSLAGPAANLGVAAVIGLVFKLGLVDPYTPLGFGLAFLGLLQVAAAMFNLIPIPPLDGFNALAPMLPPRVVEVGRSIGFAGFFLIFFAFRRIPALNEWFWEPVWQVADHLNIPWWSAMIGDAFARFQF